MPLRCDMIAGSRRAWKWLAAGAAALMVLHPVQASASQSDAEQQQALRGIAMLDQRIANIAHRLAMSVLPYCSRPAPLPGFTVHHLSQYSGNYRDAAVRVFGLEKGPRVLALVKGGPADIAGLKRNDLILELDGQKLMPAGQAGDPASAGSSEAIARIQDRIAQGFRAGFADILLERDGRRLALRVGAQPGCASAVHLEPSGKLNARADGENVVITTAISMIVNDDDELAAVLAHELAHNLLEHKSRLDTVGWARACHRRAEVEADRLGVHLLDGAGYDPEAAIRFWKHFGPRKQTLFSGSEHPSWRRRVEILGEEIARLHAAKADRPDTASGFQPQADGVSGVQC